MLGVRYEEQDYSGYSYNLNAYKSETFKIISVGPSFRLGNKWYTGISPNYRIGFQVTWINFGVTMGNGGTNLLISPLSVGVTNIFKLKKSNGLEANIDLGPALLMNWSDLYFGVGIAPGIKYRYKLFAIGIDYRYNFMNRSSVDYRNWGG